MALKVWTLFLLLALSSCKKEVDEESFVLPPLPEGINVLKTGAAGNGIQDDTWAFEKAMQLADSLHVPVVVPAGKYRADIRVQFDNIVISGQLQPSATFKYGTQIIGSINCNNKKNILLQNLGIDARNSQQTAALTSGDGIDSLTLNQTYKNISLLGGGFQDYHHGILCQTGRYISMQNILVKNFYHGIAIRSGNVTVDSVTAISCGFTSLIIKAAESKNKFTKEVSVSHVTINGNPSNPYERGGMILIQSSEDESSIEQIQIEHVNSFHGGISAIAVDQLKGNIQKVRIYDCIATGQGDDNNRACFDIKGGSDITLSNCSSNQARGIGFKCSGIVSRIRAEQCFESGSGLSPWLGNFSYLQLNGLEIIK